MHEDIPTTGWKINKTILEQNMETQKNIRKAEWINNMDKLLPGLQEGRNIPLFTQSNT